MFKFHKSAFVAVFSLDESAATPGVALLDLADTPVEAGTLLLSPR